MRAYAPAFPIAPAHWKRGLQEMSPLQIAQSAFEKVYQTEMSAELTDLFQEAYISATRKEEEEGE